MAAVIQVKRGTASSWTSSNPVLAAGEVGFETDTKKMKVGDGTTAWTSLTYTATDGDISEVTAGTGLSGGGSSGSVTVSLDTTSQYVVPSQTTHSGKYLTTDGTTSSWGTVDLSGKTDKSTLSTTGDIYYASAANTPARLGIGSTGQVLTVSGGIPSWATAAGGSFDGVWLHLNYSVPQNVSTNSIRYINWDGETYDVGGFHDNVTNNSRITIPSGKAGYYLFYSYIEINYNYGNALGMHYIGFRKNGTGTVITTQGNKQNTGYSTGAGTSGAGAPDGHTAFIIQQMNVGDYMECGVYQDTNGQVTLHAGGHASRFGAYRIGS